ncbi:hypothetical protein [Prescottella equi]|uniref:Putative integral membrane protein n=1 Tax=Rhodococcus hoagii TaxID=43767 RepID=B4F397_RHOHA|nr:hypothetical protein [Prescottella equi]ADI50216.1 putative integral membrane protein [Prescottella equi]ARX58945.1 putative integral membrane protein [Prescottella equi]ARX59049.1 putative integral membrane protein [Prescottella equi]ARX59098.1 putative integral membrane protein [Prescottella equi]ARX59180.1 putative integral membrane protein [Prescottella equi]
MLHTVLDTAVLAQNFDINPEVPPGANGLLKLLNWLLWGVTLACVAALVFSGGKFAWEKWQNGQSDAVKMLVGSLVGAIVAISANSILSAVTSA